MMNNNIELSFSKKEFKVLMETIKCASKEEYRPTIRGIFFSNGDVVSLDGYRMMVRHCSTPFDGEFIILATELNNVVKSLKKDVEIIELNVDVKRNIYDITLLNKMMEKVNSFSGDLVGGVFPAYKQLMPSEAINTEIVIDSKTILDILKPLKKNQRCILEIADEIMVIKEIKADPNDYSKDEKIAIGDIMCNKHGKDISIAFNNSYIKDALKNFDVANIKFTDNLHGTIVSDFDEKRLDLILPVRLYR